jgi:hypothetical protein
MVRLEMGYFHDLPHGYGNLSASVWHLSPFDLMFVGLVLARQGVCVAGLSHDL